MSWKWSARLRHPEVDIKGRIIIRLRKQMHFGALDAVCILIDTPLYDQQEIYKWKLKMIGMSGGAVFAGICLRSSIQQHSFGQFAFAQKDHGHYVLSKFKYTIASGNLEINLKERGFNYAKQDILSFEYNTEKRTFKISKYNSENQQYEYTFQVEPAPHDDCYYPCAYLWHVNDAVELLNE